MKKIFILFTLIFTVTIARAEVFVLKDINTNEVIMVSESDNFSINQEDLEVVKLPNNLYFYNLTESYDMYLLKNKKFSLNTVKITAKEDKVKKDKDKKNEKDMLLPKLTIKLMGLGLTEDEAALILK